MKKRLVSVLTVAVLVFSSLTAVHCDDDITDYGIKVLLNGTPIEFDVPPQIIDSRTMVPMRAIFQALGANVAWDDITKSVHANRVDEYGMDTYVIMQIGSNTLVKFVADTPTTKYVSTNEITLDVAPLIIGDRTLVPIRAVSEAFDCEVDWDDETRTVTITAVLPAEPDKTVAPIVLPAAAPTEAATAEPTAAPTEMPTAASTAEPTVAPTEMPTAAPTAEPAADADTSASSDIPIEYDGTNELQSHNVRDFKIIACETNADGDYVITYRLRTFFEGKGAVSADFNCLSESGAVIDSFGGMYTGTDYTWSWHEDTATVSGKTAKIEFVLND